MKEETALKLIDERDAAEQALSQAYYLITGKSPEWSNLFGYAEALQEIDEAQQILRAVLVPAWEDISMANLVKDQRYAITTNCGDSVLSATYNGKSFWIHSLGDVEPWPKKNVINVMPISLPAPPAESED